MRKQQIFILTLIISLIINIFLGGILIGKRFYGAHPDFHSPPHMRLPPMYLERLLEDLPPEKAELVRPIIIEHITQFRAHFRDITASRRAVYEQLTAEKVNQQALSEAIVIMQQNVQKTREIMYKTLIKIAIHLDKTEREKLVDGMSHMYPLHEGRRYGKPHFQNFPPGLRNH
jgi:uncharacterized membrane protein